MEAGARIDCCIFWHSTVSKVVGLFDDQCGVPRWQVEGALFADNSRRARVPEASAAQFVHLNANHRLVVMWPLIV